MSPQHASQSFDYATAFSRNIGWLTPTEQAWLRGRRLAVAGLGGVGGVHLLTLARLGVGAFHLADFDRFELHNFNRQAGATMATLDRPKLDVMAEAALSINPELDIRRFPDGVTDDNLDAFFDGVDLYVDALDFFVLPVRRKVFAAAHARGIPAITAAPLGMGTAVLTFLPGRMSFEDYFQVESQPEEEQYARFLVGLSPTMLQQGYLVDRSTINFVEKRGPSTPMACELAAGVLVTESLKLLLGRGPVRAAPWGLHFDAYRNRLSRTWRPGGNRHPLNRLTLAIMRTLLRRARSLPAPARAAPAAPAGLDPRVARVLELASWAPSGDNTQPWRFEAVDPLTVIVHGCDTRDHVIYDLRGRPSQLALGALLETARIAAPGAGLALQIETLPGVGDTTPAFAPMFRLQFTPAAAAVRHPLETAIRARCTQRRPLSRRPLTDAVKAAFLQALGPGYALRWLEGDQRLDVAKLLFRNAHIRLTTPEAYPTHRDIIEFGVQYSEDRLPGAAVGLDPVGLALMRWAMKSWERVDFLNRWFAGTWLPRLQLDFAPALGCAAHFLIVAEQAPQTLADYLAAGAAMQRFWLTATRLGLQFQPEMTPLIFSGYIRDGIEFTKKQASIDNARTLARQLDALVGADTAARAVYFGRLGYGPVPVSRSTRLPLARLMTGGGSPDASPQKS